MKILLTKYKFLFTFIVALLGIGLFTLITFKSSSEDGPETRRVPEDEIRKYLDDEVLGENKITAKKPNNSEEIPDVGETQSSNSRDNNQNSSNNAENSNSGNNGNSDNREDEPYRLTLTEFQKYIKALKKEEINEIEDLNSYISEIKDSINNTKYNNRFTQAFVTPEEGGILETDYYKVTFSAGAVDEPLIVTLQTKYSNQNSEKKVLNNTFNLTATNVYLEEVSKFNKEITIETKLTAEDLVDTNTSEIGTYFLNEETNRWEKIQSEADRSSVIAYSDHFTEFVTTAEEPSVEEEEENPVDDCDFFIDDSFDVDSDPDDDIDRTICFMAIGPWEPSDIGTLQTSLYADGPFKTAFWIPDFKNLEGSHDVYVTIPYIREILDNDEEYTAFAKYGVLHAEGVEEIIVDLQAHAGETYKLGTFNFDGDDAAVALAGIDIDSIDSVEDMEKYVVADAVCFDTCPEGVGDVTPPKIEDVKSNAVQGYLYIEAKVTDESGIMVVYVWLNGVAHTMNAQGDIYSVRIPYNPGENLDYLIEAFDSYGNPSRWNPTRGYVSRGAGFNLGIPPWKLNASCYKETSYGRIIAALPGSDRCSSYVGDPIDTSTGNLLEQVELIKVEGRPEIDLKLKYNSLGGNVTIFGESWRHEYMYHVVSMDNADFKGAFVEYPSGYTATFTGDNLAPEAGNFDKLEKEGDGYKLTLRDKAQVYFDSFGDVTRIEDINDNGLNFEYSEQFKYINLSKLSNIKADGGREITFDYNDKGLVSQINAPEGKIIKLGYNESDDLISVIDANEGELKFEYADHAITKKLSPEGHAYYENTYDNQRRVTKQKAGASFTQDYTYNANETVVTDLNGTTAKYQYNADGLMTSNIDESGGVTTFKYNDKKLVIEETDAAGVTTLYDYDSDGNQDYMQDGLNGEVNREFNDLNKLTKEIDQEGNETNYEYDTKGNLIKVTNALGEISAFVYDSKGQLIASADFNGNVTQYEYSEAGDLIEITDPLGHITTFSYDNLGRKVQEIDPKGHVYAYTYDKNNNLTKVEGPLGYTLNFKYDKNNRLIEETDANGGVIKYLYDTSENLIKVTNQLGFETSIEYGQMNEELSMIDPEGRVTKYSYNPTYEVNKVTLAAGSTNESIVSIGYNARRIQKQIIDPNGRIVNFEFDPLYRITREISDATGITASTIYEYDPTGGLKKEIDANGNETSYEVDALDRVTKVTNAEGGETKFDYDAIGNLVKLTNPNGFETNYEYDKLNRITKITNAQGNSITYEYDPNGNLIKEVNENGIETTYTYNELDRLVEQKEADVIITKYEYDLHGNLTKIVNPRGYETRFEYDLAHRNTAVIDAKGNATRFEYDRVNNLVKVTDRNENVTTQQYDELNRVITEINAENLQTSFSYDKLDNITSLTDPRGSITNFEYDGLNRMTRVVDAMGGTWNYEFDKEDNLLKEVDANGNPTSYTYDKIYRLLSETNAEGHVTSFAYDANSNVVTLTDPKGNSSSFTYDELDRLTSKIDALNGESIYEYDAVGNIVREVDENGNAATYELDNINRITKVIDAEGNETELKYDNNSNIVEIIDGNGHSTVYSYDELDFKISEVNAEGEEVKFDYDSEGLLTDEIAPDGIVKRYNYDKIYRLIRVIENFHEGNVENSDTNVDTLYSYDANGNLIEIKNPNENSTNFEYDPLNRQIKEVDAEGNTWTYSYDAVGNRTVRVDANGNRTEYAYYPDNMLASVNYQNGTGISYQYDENNNRVVMNDSIGATEWSYDALNRPLSVNDALGRTLAYTYDPVGNRTSVTYPSGSVVNYGYYKNNWLKNLNTDSEDVVSYTRDGVGNTIGVANSNETSTSISYDKVNRMTNITNTAKGGVNSSFAYTYNDAGFRTNVVANFAWRKPEIVETNYTYDSLRRLIKSDDSEGIYSEYAYDRAGNRLSHKTNDQGITNIPYDELTQEYSYNDINQIMSIVQEGKTSNGKNTPNSENTLQSLYALRHELEAQRGKHISELDADNILLSLNELILGIEADTLSEEEIEANIATFKDQITNVSISGNGADGIRNSLLVKVSKAEESNKGKSGDLQAITFEYDNNGNRIEMDYPDKGNSHKDLIQYGYDPENRLDYYNGLKTNEEITMNYDGMGRRLAKQYANSNKRMEYTFDNLDPVAQFNTQNNQFTNYYRGDKNQIAVGHDFPSGTNGQKFWYHYDALGSVVGLTKSGGQSDHNYRYNNFGSIEPQNGNFTDPHNSFTYTGQELEEVAGLYEFYARAYDPFTGVWLQQDIYRGTRMDPMTLHRYGYVKNSPITYYDVYGFSENANLEYLRQNDDNSKLNKTGYVNTIEYNGESVLVYIPPIQEINSPIYTWGLNETGNEIVRKPIADTHYSQNYFLNDSNWKTIDTYHITDTGMPDEYHIFSALLQTDINDAYIPHEAPMLPYYGNDGKVKSWKPAYNATNPKIQGLAGLAGLATSAAEGLQNAKADDIRYMVYIQEGLLDLPVNSTESCSVQPVLTKRAILVGEYQGYRFFGGTGLEKTMYNGDFAMSVEEYTDKHLFGLLGSSDMYRVTLKYPDLYSNIVVEKEMELTKDEYNEVIETLFFTEK